MAGGYKRGLPSFKISEKKDEIEWVQKSPKKKMKMNGFKNLPKKR
jgi:hypothetical protein